jgi:hypothetical protein
MKFIIYVITVVFLKYEIRIKITSMCVEINKEKSS